MTLSIIIEWHKRQAEIRERLLASAHSDKNARDIWTAEMKWHREAAEYLEGCRHD